MDDPELGIFTPVDTLILDANVTLHVHRSDKEGKRTVRLGSRGREVLLGQRRDNQRNLALHDRTTLSHASSPLYQIDITVGYAVNVVTVRGMLA